MAEPPDEPVDDFPDPQAVARREAGDRAADLGPIQSVVLREGPRSRKVARWMTVKNRHTGEVHHHALTLETGKKRQGTWELDDKRSIGLSDEDDDEIGRLVTFIQRCRGEAVPPPPAPPPLHADLDGLIARLSGLRGAVDDLRRIARVVRAGGADLRAVGAAIAFGAGARTMDRLRVLMAARPDPTTGEPPDPAALRDLLAAFPWLLGLAHAEAVGLPAGLAGSPELVLLHTADERPVLVMVVGPPDAAPLMAFDPERQAYEPGPGLVRAIAGLTDALAVCEPGTRGRMVIGEDGDAAHHQALRRLAAQLARIEIMTFDHVLRTGHRVLEGWRAAAKR